MSKVLGIVRKLDDLGRVTIPKEWRKLMNLEYAELIRTEEGILIRPYTKGKMCPCCGMSLTEKH